MKVILVREQIKRHIDDWHDCTRCSLGFLAQKHVLFETVPEGVTKLDILFIGEAPGRMENIRGIPFIGKSGRFLRNLIELGAPTDLRYGITNVVACRPTDSIMGPNRAPQQEEIDACNPRLVELINIFQPKMIILVGAYARENAVKFIRNSTFKGKIQNIAHPASFLYSGNEHDEKTIKEQSEKLRGFFQEARE